MIHALEHTKFTTFAIHQNENDEDSLEEECEDD
jgi:hypothetical protein